jgi:RES domain.
VAFFAATSNTNLEGGRFDALDASFAHLYLGEDLAACLAETVLRGVPFTVDGYRQLPVRALEGRVHSRIQVMTGLDTLSLVGAGASRVGQDEWLATCGADAFLLTRQWAVALRRWAPDAAGFEWVSRPASDRRSYVLFDDRVDGASLVCDRGSQSLLGSEFRSVMQILNEFGVAIDMKGWMPRPEDIASQREFDF